MKKLAVMITLFCSCALAQVYQPINGWCQLGGAGIAAPTSLGGVPVQQFVQESFTGCTITIYTHGTTSPATIYSTSSGTVQANPFQADTLIGFYQAFAASGLYDVQESGNVSPPVLLGTVGLFDISSYSPPVGGSNAQVEYNCSGALCGSPNFTWGDPVLNINGSVNSAFKVITNAANTYGGYIDFPPLSYPTTICRDAFGNPVGIPVPVGGGSFGTNDLVIWNSLSPLPGVTPPGCATPLTTNVLYGLNTNGYWFAAGGYATDQPAFNAVHAFTGGVTAASITAGGFYPPGTVTACCGTLGGYTFIGGYMAMGHSSGPPATGTVATVNNPLTLYDGLEQGTFYWDDGL